MIFKKLFSKQKVLILSELQEDRSPSCRTEASSKQGKDLSHTAATSVFIDYKSSCLRPLARIPELKNDPVKNIFTAIDLDLEY